MRLRTTISLLIVAAFGASLAACGGGSVSSGGGSGSGGSGASSSLVVQAPQNAGVGDFQQERRHTSLAAIVSDFFISDALAQEGETVFLLDADGNVVATGVADGSGQAVIPVNSGEYVICIGTTDPENCTVEPVSVGDDEVVVATLALEGETLILVGVEVERAQDNIVAFQDPDNAHKTLVCHKGKFTISVGTPAAQKGHMAHGDSLGECPPDEPEQTAETEEFGTSGGGNGNQGNNGNRGNNGNNGNSSSS